MRYHLCFHIYIYIERESEREREREREKERERKAGKSCQTVKFALHYPLHPT